MSLKLIHSTVRKDGSVSENSATNSELIEKLKSGKIPVGVVGLGYVGLPLACHLAKTYKVRGLDINAQRIRELSSGHDATKEISDAKLLIQDNLNYTTDPNALAECGVVIVAVPTPIDRFNRPDLSPLISASTAIGKVLRKGSIVVYESTVYPGVTEDECGRVLEEVSGLKCNKDFFLGYSPERINPGDKFHTIDKIIKVVAGSTPETTELLAWLYGNVTTAGIHKASSIKVAEASKIIENIQRDVNIALINECTMIFDTLNINMTEVLEASRTKWNFLNFYPGLVGGHCIGVDPYYLTHLAEKQKCSASLISTSRLVNESMPRFLANRTLCAILKSGALTTDTPFTVGILGAAFKENVPDVRNTKVVDLAIELERFGCKVHIVDEYADKEDFSKEYGRELVPFDRLPQCHALVIAVRHDAFVKNFSPERLKTRLKAPFVVLDFKEILRPSEARALGLKLY